MSNLYTLIADGSLYKPNRYDSWKIFARLAPGEAFRSPLEPNSSGPTSYIHRLTIRFPFEPNLLGPTSYIHRLAARYPLEPNLPRLTNYIHRLTVRSPLEPTCLDLQLIFTGRQSSLLLSLTHLNLHLIKVTS
ncbi:hypothetical protein AMTR_s00133p00117250 [Amborella trichopoda]|uniref:Uncharacterized protein n=1 Tax=Amborella trichopoda TaxID=13333 RepID=W1PBP7_AMBTC|nr:hypothetical protein AMTR_s00133p00117250 [Amborella trichopoda]